MQPNRRTCEGCGLPIKNKIKANFESEHCMFSLSVDAMKFAAFACRYTFTTKKCICIYRLHRPTMVDDLKSVCILCMRRSTPTRKQCNPGRM